MTLGILTLGIMTLGIMTLGIMTLGIMTLGITMKAETPVYAECRNEINSVAILYDIMLIVIMLSVVISRVVAPSIPGIF